MRAYVCPLQKKKELISQIESAVRNRALLQNETDSTSSSITKADFVATLGLEWEVIGKLNYYNNSIAYWQSANLYTDEKVSRLTELLEKYSAYCDTIEERINNHLK